MQIEEDRVLGLLQGRYQDVFEALAGGGEVSPGQRLRTEGMMETLVLLGVADVLAVQELMDACYAQAFGRTLAEEWGGEWRELFPFPQLPGFGQRAPVVPSTRD